VRPDRAEVGQVQGFKHHDKADKFKVELTLDKANASDFDALMLPGGVINAEDRSCRSWSAPENRSPSSFTTPQDDLRNAGAQWEDKECIRDRNWVSSRKLDDLPVFNREMVKLFSESRIRAEKKEGVEIRA
jgi:deglycase